MSVRTGLKTIVAATEPRGLPDTALEYAWELAVNGEARIAPARQARKNARTATGTLAFPIWRATTPNQFGIKPSGQLPAPQERAFSPLAGLRPLLLLVPPEAMAACVKREAGTGRIAG
jgi:hypothetical protein